MKHLILFFAFAFFTVTSSNAQSCSKAAAGKACCAAKKSASASASTDNAVQIASISNVEADAAVVASNGAITKRTCEMSGTTTYFEKSVCAHSGKVSWEEVQYDVNKKAFTKVASASMEKDENGAKVETKSCAGKMEGKACCKKDGAKSCAAQKAGNK